MALTETVAKQARPGATAILPSFSEAVDQNKAMVFSIAWHFFRDRVVAEELAQDVFLRLYRSWNSMESREHIECWLRKTMTHRCIDEIRHRKAQPHISLEDAEEPGTLERLQDPLLASYLERMVASLPEKQRMLVILRYQEGLEPDEISKLLGIKPSTVRTMLGRAIALLRAKTWRRLSQEGTVNGVI